MTQPELILRLVEMLLAERDKNSQLKAEEHKKSKMCELYNISKVSKLIVLLGKWVRCGKIFSILYCKDQKLIVIYNM